MHDHRRLITDRLARVLRERLRPAVRRTVEALDIEAWHLPGEPVPPAEALRYTGYKPFAVGESWGPPWGTTWFHLTGDVPVPDGELEIVVDLGWSDPRDAGAGKAHRRSGRLATGGGRAAVEAGYQLNLPLRSVMGDAGVPPLVTVGEGVVVEALKLADDRSGDLVIRLYESLGRGHGCGWAPGSRCEVWSRPTCSSVQWRRTRCCRSTTAARILPCARSRS